MKNHNTHLWEVRCPRIRSALRGGNQHHVQLHNPCYAFAVREKPFFLYLGLKWVIFAQLYFLIPFPSSFTGPAKPLLI